MVKISKEAALAYHESGRPGKIEVKPTKAYRTQTDLSLAYSPGVAYPCLEIQENPDNAYRYTDKGNLVAVISNGTTTMLWDLNAYHVLPDGYAVDWASTIYIDWGSFISAVINFLLVALILFIIIKTINNVHKAGQEAKAKLEEKVEGKQEEKKEEK